LAQDEPALGSRLRHSGNLPLAVANQRAVRGAHNYATCVVHRRESLARAYLDATTAQEIAKSSSALFRDIECLDIPGFSGFAIARRIAMPEDVQRGILAEAMLKQEGGLRAAFAPQPLAKTYQAPWSAISGRGPVVDEMAVCVSQTDPQGVANLLATLPESEDEQQAIGAISPYLGPCLQNGAQLTANRQSLRAALAEALYHRWEAQQAAGNAAPAAAAGG